MILSSLLPPILVLPVAAILLLVVSAHLRTTVRLTQPPSRRRIRTANGWVMLLAIPILAAGFAIVDHQSHPTEWLLIWLFGIGLLSISLMLAALDIANTLRLARKSARMLQRRLRSMQGESIRRAKAECDANSGEQQGAGA